MTNVNEENSVEVSVTRLSLQLKFAGIFVTVIFGSFAAAIVNYQIQITKLEIEKEIQSTKIQIEKEKSESEQTLKEMETLGNYLKYALDKDSNIRLRFTEYFKHVTVSPKIKSNWREYHKSLQAQITEEQELKFALDEAANKGDDKAALKINAKLKIAEAVNGALDLNIYDNEAVATEKYSKHDFNTIQMIIETCVEFGVTDHAQIAYILASVEHETNKTFRTTKEAYWLSESWRKKNLRYYPYYGRGFIHLVHDYNYKRLSEILKVDLVKSPDEVMNSKIAAKILVISMRDGLFTGKRLSSYINERDVDFVKARYVVHGRDKREYIAKIAEKFLKLIQANIFDI